MKHIPMLIAASLLINNVKAQSFTLNGTIEGKASGFAYLNYTAKGNKRQTDSAKIQNGKFAFAGQLDGPTMSSLSLEPPSRMSYNADYTTLFIEPGKMTATLKAGIFAMAG